MLGLELFGDGIGLPRMLRYLQAAEIDEDWLSRSSIAVVGSNGKGSTAGFLSALLSAAGDGAKRVGRFTSPHLYDVRERIAIDGTPIPHAAFDRLAERALAAAPMLDAGRRIGSFEALFMIAASWFAEQQVDAMVWEAGLGGRYDPVRAVRARVGVLTSVEIEHAALLGATEELIAFDKADVVPPGGVLVLAAGVPEALRPRIAEVSSLADRRCVDAAQALGIENFRDTRDGARFSARPLPGGRNDAPPTEAGEISINLPLIGRHQADNAIAALCAARLFLDARQDWRRARLDWMAEALQRAHWPGRLEKVAANPDLWIDVGHTPRAIEAVGQAYANIADPGKTLVLFGLGASKDGPRCCAALAARFDRIVVTHPHAGAEPAALAALLREAGVPLGQTRVIADLRAATLAARKQAQAEGLSVLAIGGHALAGGAALAWRGGDPEAIERL